MVIEFNDQQDMWRLEKYFSHISFMPEINVIYFQRFKKYFCFLNSIYLAYINSKFRNNPCIWEKNIEFRKFRMLVWTTWVQI